MFNGLLRGGGGIMSDGREKEGKEALGLADLHGHVSFSMMAFGLV